MPTSTPRLQAVECVDVHFCRHRTAGLSHRSTMRLAATLTFHAWKQGKTYELGTSAIVNLAEGVSVADSSYVAQDGKKRSYGAA